MHPDAPFRARRPALRLPVGLAPWRHGPPPLWAPAVATVASAAAIVGLSRALPVGWPRLALELTGCLLVFAVLIQQAARLLARDRAADARALAMRLAEDDPDPACLVDPAGAILARNAAARALRPPPATLVALLPPEVADAPALVAHLTDEARRRGAIDEEGRARRGPWRLSVRRVDEGALLWRLARPEGGEGADLPRLTLGPADDVLSANAALRSLAGAAPARLRDLLRDQPLVSGRVHQLATAAGAVARVAAVLPGLDGRRDIYLLPPDAIQAAPPPAADGWADLDDLPVALLRLSVQGVVLAANRHARTLLPPLTEGESRLSDLLEGLGRPVGDWIGDVAAGRAAAAPQVLRGTGEGQDTVVRVTLRPSGPPDAPWLVAVLDDVTELKSLEAQFVQSQKMQALGQLAGGVAHDFNNLLTAISGHSDLLLLRHDAGDPAYTDLVQIRQNVNRAAGLVGQLLAFSRKQSLMPETIDLRVVLSDLTHLLNRLVGERVRLTLDHEPTLRFVRADRRQLEQVIMNLVVNARDAMPDGGAIRIETANHHLAEATTKGEATLPAGDWVLVRVVDHGTGIPPERLPKIFDPFYTTKRPGEGTGLGLSTVYGIVKQSGGYVFVESDVGAGSTFTIWLPAHDRPAAVAPAPARPASRPAPAPRGGAVLLVEDEAGVRAFAARALRLRGHAVLEADSGEAALAILADPATRVDLVLTDVILPDQDGPTWVRHALADRPALRVVFMSGYAEDAFPEQKALIAGSTFLPKPFSLSDLAEVVERQLADPPPP